MTIFEKIDGRGPRCRRRACFAVLAIVLAVGCRDSGSAGSQTKEPQPLEVELALTANKSSYTLRDSIALTVTFVSRTDSPLYFERHMVWGSVGGLNMTVREAKTGLPVQVKLYDDGMPAGITSKEGLIALVPHGRLTWTRSPTISDINIFDPGSYTISISYLPTILSEESFGLPVWGKERDDIHSNALTIRVTP